MSDREALPRGWRRTSLRAETEERKERVGTAAPPLVLSSTKHRGLVPSDDFFRNRTIYSQDLSNYKSVSKNWFAYATNHLAEGSIGLQDKFASACVSPIYTVFSCREGVDPSYLFRLLKTPELISQYKLHEQASVDRRGAIRYQDFGKIPLVLPPLGEQRRIGQILDTIDKAIGLAERLVAKLEQAKQGLLYDLLTRGVGESGNLRDLGQINRNPATLWPPSWKVAPAERFCDKISVGVVNSATAAYRDSGVPFIRSQNVRPNRIVLDDVLHITDEFNKIQGKSILRPGDVVIVRTGYPGIAAVIPNELNGANCFSLIICRPKPILDPRFLSCYMNSPVGKALVRRTHFGSAQHNFNIGEMKRLLIPVPSLTEQRKILLLVDAADRDVLVETELLQKTRLLKRGLMDDLLTGRVRIGASG
jgi:type I restriction enzyme, S subunit